MLFTTPHKVVLNKFLSMHVSLTQNSRRCHCMIWCGSHWTLGRAGWAEYFSSVWLTSGYYTKQSKKNDC